MQPISACFQENLESKEGITEVTRQTKSSFVDAENKFALLSLLDG